MVLLEGGKAFPWKEDALSPSLFLFSQKSAKYSAGYFTDSEEISSGFYNEELHERKLREFERQVEKLAQTAELAAKAA